MKSLFAVIYSFPEVHVQQNNIIVINPEKVWYERWVTLDIYARKFLLKKHPGRLQYVAIVIYDQYFCLVHGLNLVNYCIIIKQKYVSKTILKIKNGRENII